MSDSERIYWLLLVYESDLQTRKVHGIITEWCLKRHQSLETFFELPPRRWREEFGLSADEVQKLERTRSLAVGQSFLLESLSNENVELMTLLDPDYPIDLKRSLANSASPILFYKGDKKILTKPAAAIIGSREPAPESLEFAKVGASYLAGKGFNIVSGYAKGVDRAAFEGALEKGVTTIVLPQGIRTFKSYFKKLDPYIKESRSLVISQFHPNAGWKVGLAMARNKIISGLARYVIVAECGRSSGTWQGANEALKQRKPLFVRVDQVDGRGNKESASWELVRRGGIPIEWPAASLDRALAPITVKSDNEQLSLFED